MKLKKCVFCGDHFAVTNHAKRYCNVKCRRRAERDRHRDANNAKALARYRSMRADPEKAASFREKLREDYKKNPEKKLKAGAEYRARLKDDPERLARIKERNRRWEKLDREKSPEKYARRAREYSRRRSAEFAALRAMYKLETGND